MGRTSCTYGLFPEQCLTGAVFYEFIFKDDYPYQPGARVWANGDDAGFSFHGRSTPNLVTSVANS